MTKRKKIKSRKKKAVLANFYKSGKEGKGKKETYLVETKLTPEQLRKKWYASELHERTEFAMTATSTKIRSGKNLKF